MATPKEVSGIDEVLCNAAAMNKPSQVGINDARNQWSQPVHHHLCKEFHGAILQGDGSEGVSSAGPVLLGQQDKICLL